MKRLDSYIPVSIQWLTFFKVQKALYLRRSVRLAYIILLFTQNRSLRISTWFQ